MQKIIYAFLFIVGIGLSIPSFAQLNTSNLGFNYYALVRDTAGRVQASKAVKLRFTFLLGQNGSATTSPWVETQNTTTDAFGFVNVTIGNGTKAGGTASTFAAVDFTIANYAILIEVFNATTAKYELLAKQTLLAVPYAKVAGSVAGGPAVPPGTMVAFAGDVAHVPPGWLLCDGRELDNTNPSYAALFSAIQYNWGTSNHANLFNIPITNGLFLRGASNGSANDPDRAGRAPSNLGANGGDNVGSAQQDAMHDHKHNLPPYYIPGVPGISWYAGGNGFGASALSTQSVDTEGGAINLSTETRPKNISVNYIIKL